MIFFFSINLFINIVFHFHINLKNPTIVFPQNYQTNELIMIDLGEISIFNKFEKVYKEIDLFILLNF